MNRSTTSASNIFRRDLCPGSGNAEELYPEEEDSEWSEEGTLLHRLSANPGDDRSALTGNQQDVLEIAARAENTAIRAVMDQCGIADDEPFQEGWEEEMWFGPNPLKRIFPGHCDYWRFWPRLRVLLITDKKFGYNEVTPADSNLQMRSYACMGSVRWDADRIFVGINQPRAEYDNRLTLAEYSRESIGAARAHLMAIWTACQAPDAVRIAGQEQCRYCKARLHCPEYRAQFEFLASSETRAITSGTIRSLTADQLDRVLTACACAEMVHELAKNEARDRVLRGEFPLYKVGKDSAKRFIGDASKAIAMLAAVGIDRAQLERLCTLPVTATQDLVRERFGLTAKDAKERLKAILGAVLGETPTRGKLERVKSVSLPGGSDRA